MLPGLAADLSHSYVGVDMLAADDLYSGDLGRWGGGFTQAIQNTGNLVQQSQKDLVTGKLQLKDAAWGPLNPIREGIRQSIRQGRERRRAGGQDVAYVAYHVLALQPSAANGFIELWLDADGNEITQAAFDQLALSGPTTAFYYDGNANEITQPDWQARLDAWARGKLPPTLPPPVVTPQPVQPQWTRSWIDYNGHKIRVAQRSGWGSIAAGIAQSASTPKWAWSNRELRGLGWTPEAGTSPDLYARPYFGRDRGPAFAGGDAINQAKAWIDQQIAARQAASAPIVYNGGTIYPQRNNATAVLGTKRSPLFVPGWGADAIAQAKEWIDANAIVTPTPPPTPVPAGGGYDPLALIRSGKSFGMQGLGYLGAVNRLRRAATSGAFVRGARVGGKTITLGPKSGMWY